MTTDALLHAQIKALREEMTTYALTVQKRIEAIEAKYSPDQPRAPRGDSDGGQWTDGSGGGDSGGPSGTGSPRTSPTSGSGNPRTGRRGTAGKPFKVDTAIQSLHRNLSPKTYGGRNCALNVASAIRATDITVTPPLPPRGEKYPFAKDYGPSLEDAEFSQVAENDVGGVYPPDKYTPRKGDVVVIQSVSNHKEGHMAMYDGQQWVSDFKQQNDI